MQHLVNLSQPSHLYYLLPPVLVGTIFGIDFSDPQTVMTILGGGGGLVTVIILWRLITLIVTRIFNHQDKDEKNESELLDLFRVVLTRMTDALEHNTAAMNSLKDFTEKDHDLLNKRLDKFEKKLTEISDKR